MINLEITEKRIQELVEEKAINTIIQSCDCFNTMTSDVNVALQTLTNQDIGYISAKGFLYGDINNLGSFTSKTYTFDDQEVEIFNLYAEYAKSQEGFETVHWSSVYDGIVRILSQLESGSVVAVGWIRDAEQNDVFYETLEELAKENDNELPDVDIVIFEN